MLKLYYTGVVALTTYTFQIMAHLDVQPKRRSNAWIWLIILIILIAAGIFFYKKYYHGSGTAMQADSAKTTTTTDTTIHTQSK